MANVVLVDDDRNLLTSLSMLLEGDGHNVKSFTDPEIALRDIGTRKADLAVLDVHMPQLDGFEMLRRIRTTSSLPVMFLSGDSSEIDEAMGLRLGADDYVNKPFSPRVLVERVRACLRRKDAELPDVKPSQMIAHGALEMDRECHTVRWNGTTVRLTSTEFDVLWIIAQRPGHVHSRAKILDDAYGQNIHVTDRSIDSQIKRLRLKFRKVDPDFDAIETLYGLGYRFVSFEGSDAN